MPYDPAVHHRRSIRLKGFDYRQGGCYFLTICTFENRHIFGEIVGGASVLTGIGRMVQGAWFELPRRYVAVQVDAFVAMPNHVHGVLVLLNPGRARGPAPTPNRGVGFLSIPDVVHRFKSLTTSLCRKGATEGKWASDGPTLWQRNYFERIIRNAREYSKVLQYIHENPARWQAKRDGKFDPSRFAKRPWL